MPLKKSAVNVIQIKRSEHIIDRKTRNTCEVSTMAGIKAKLIAAAMGTVLCTAVFSYTAAEVSAPVDTTVTGSFSSVDNALTADYYYNDSYFRAPGSQSSEQLRTMSLALAVSAYQKTEQTRGCNIHDVLDKTGFDTSTMQTDELDVTTRTSVGSVIATKRIDGKPLVAVAVRGFDYRDEWASNFDSGETGDANGFSESAKKLIQRIKDFEQKNDCKGAKLWLTGYSRAGCICDLTGKYINEHLDEFGITADELYDYTFEAPHACTKASGYSNIHNVYCDMDIIPKMYPQQWGFYSSGTPEKLELSPQEINVKTLSIMDGFKIKDTGDKMQLSEFEDKFVEWLSKKLSRERFCSDCKPVTDAAVDIISVQPQQRAKMLRYLKSVSTALGEHFKSSKLEVLKIAGILGSGTVKKKSVEYLTKVLLSVMDDADHSGAFSDEQYEKLKEAVPAAAELVVDLLKDDLSDNDLNYFPTFFSYAGQIVKYHYSIQVWEAVTANDRNYSASRSTELSQAA